MGIWRPALAAALLCSAAPVLAGGTVLYEPVPDWVDVYDVDFDEVAKGPAEILHDWQYRLEGGVVYRYEDRVVRLDNPQALMDQGTLLLNWAPDKGDLAIHRLELIRDGEIIDLLAQDVRFEVLRREEMLEWRLLDGRLTATVAVPGMREGDILRVVHSISEDDQALGDEVQVAQYLPSEPWQVAHAQAVVSWPESDTLFWQAGPYLELGEAEARGDGYSYLAVDLPVAKRRDMPRDAPSRYNRPTMLRVGSFESWEELSREMAPHFHKAALVEPGGEVAQEIARIAAETGDPLERTVLAVRAVQDRVSYLLDGLDGGNYLPQDAEETWEKLYGDCKAKSVLLYALLSGLDIDAEVVLVASQGGDALPELLPLPANFDHMIVRATIDGVDYWLDGTSTATRMHNVANVPPFHYALPLTEAGTGLVPVAQRTKATPDFTMKIDADYSAGVDLPFLFRIEIEASGPQAAQIQSMVDQNDPALRRKLARSFSGGQMQGGVPTSIELDYDDEQAVGRVIVEGVALAEVEFENGKVVLDGQTISIQRPFSPDRARKAWQEIPVATGGPSRSRVEFALRLPGEGGEWDLAGDADIEGGYANTRISRESTLEQGVFRQVTEIIADLGEIAPDQLPAEKRAALRLANSSLKLVAPEDVKWRWDIDDVERLARTAEIRAAYDQAVSEAEDGDLSALFARAAFLSQIFDYEGAIADYSALIDAEPNAGLYLTRSYLYEAIGRNAEAIADISTSYDLEPANGTAFHLAESLAREGRAEEALALLDELPVSENERVHYAGARSMVLGLAGDVSGGLAVLAGELETRPEDATLLNADCWYRGVFAAALEDASDRCTKAVERAELPAASLDSRALVRFRLGEYEQALADLDAALSLAPWIAPIRYMKGVVSLASGDEAGREMIVTALRQSPALRDEYAQYGIEPPL